VGKVVGIEEEYGDLAVIQGVSKRALQL